MSPEPSLPTAVLIVGLPEHDEQRYLSLFESDDIRVALASSVDAEDLPFGAPDVLLIDARPGTPDLLDKVRHARRVWNNVTILCVNVGSADDAIALLGAGADDIAMAEGQWPLLVALVGAAMRRARVSNEQLRVKFGDLVYDRDSRRVWCAGREVAFTPRELRLFDILFQRAGRPVSADTLQDFVWSDGGPATSNTLAVYIGYLRRKLAGSRASMLETLRGSGYRLVRRD